MKKQKLILIAISAVSVIALLAAVYLIVCADAARTAAYEGDDENDVIGLETVEAKANTLSRKPVYPCAGSVKAIEENREKLEGWKNEAFKFAARGDRTYPATMTSAAFKEFIVNDAKRLAALPGGVNGVLMKSDFTFGPFKEFVADGKMPAEKDLGRLQRQWDDVALVIEALATNGIAEVTDIQFASKTAETDESAQNDSKSKKGKKTAKKVKEANSSASIEPSRYSYVISFKTRAPAFVKSLNALETMDRFVVVDDFSFNREKDIIAEALGGSEKKAEQASSGGGRRGRRRAAVVEEKKEEAETKNGIITDPLLDAPFLVKLTVTVYDFKTLEENKEAAKEEE